MAVSSSYFLDWPVSWFLNMTKIRAAVDDFPLPSEADKASLVAGLLLIILLSAVLIFVDNSGDAIFMCQHGVCRPVRKVMRLLTWMGALVVMINLPPSLAANGYGVYELYPYVVGFGCMFCVGMVLRLCLSLFHIWKSVSLSTNYEPGYMEENKFGTYGCLTSYSDIDKMLKKMKRRSMKENKLGTFGCSTSYSDIDKMLKKIKCRSMKEMEYLTSHARHMIDIGSLSVRLAPVVLMLVLIAIQWNPLHILIMFFYWICLNIAVMQWLLPPFAISQIDDVLPQEKNVESVIRYLGLSPLQIFLLMTGNVVFNMAKSECRRVDAAMPSIQSHNMPERE